MNDKDLSSLRLNDTTLKKLNTLGIHNLWDLVLHMPLRYEDETHLTPIGIAPVGQPCFIEAEVIAQEVQFRPKKQLIVRVEDPSGALVLRFIHFYPSQQKQMAIGTRIRALGEIRHGFFGDEMVHPKVKTVQKEDALAQNLTPVYSTVKGLNQQTLRRIIGQALNQVSLDDTLSDAVLNKLNLPSFTDTIHLLHNPPAQFSAHQLNHAGLPAWQRLKFDELLAQQLSMQLAYKKRKNGTAHIMQGTGQYTAPLLDTIGFELTNAQKKVRHEITQDLAQQYPMHRLLQGDVGSGKTIIAALSALTAIESGFQVSLMAPTEILAEQHYNKFKKWLEPLNLKVAWLSGSLTKKAKQTVKEQIERNEIHIAIGTHALFQDDVLFPNLGLVIVDEQHRFGVAQRLALKNKGQFVHQLMLSATPIPRTLAMSFFADLDVSVIDELPPNRTPIKTKMVNEYRRSEIEAWVLKTCAQGQQAYWVCPLIEESETLQLQTAVQTHEYLSEVFAGLNVGLIHGKLKPAQKADIMEKFVKNEIQVLVATTVIEVGVDVPNASLMVIEHAERMGLSQLHQLRGRVGRGQAKSMCILIFHEPLSELAKARLKVIYEHTDGFEIARQDLHIRGPGEFLGAKQSGIPLFRFANLEDDLELLEQARDLAPKLIAKEPESVQKHLMRYLSHKQDYLGV
ncbi:ATP-dependent DNA helicase RecG [Neisseria sp. Ec49-e6-T10]